jgi:hypothetical protein
VEISIVARQDLTHGKRLAASRYRELNSHCRTAKSFVKILDTDGVLIALGQVDAIGNLVPKKVFI